MDSRGPGHFSMIRSFRLADLFTLVNGFLGAGAVLSFMAFCVDTATPRSSGSATALLPLALVMDALDGRIARRRGVASPMGQELDSLADIVSFGVAPAAMAFAAGLRGGWDALFLIYFVGCGISRLARYNVSAAARPPRATRSNTSRVSRFRPACCWWALLAALAGLDRWQERLPFGAVSLGGLTLHPLGSVFGLHGSAMISKTLRIPKP